MTPHRRLPLFLSCFVTCTFAAAVHAQSGSLDTSFGGTGLVTTAMNPNGLGYDLAIEPGTNRILVACRDHIGSGNSQWAVLRYFPDGSLDPSYGVGGKASLLATSTTDTAYDIVLDSQNRAVLTGIAKLGTRYAFTVVRLNAADGSLDTSFGGTGIVQTNVGTGTAQDYSYAVAIDPVTGKIVVAGTTPGTASTKVALVRYNTDGSLDTSFGTGGKRIDDITTLNDTPRQAGLVIQADGKIVMAASKGSTGVGAYNDWVIARYNSDGSNDTGFGAAGRIFGAFTGLTNAKVWGLALQSDGKLVASGRAYHTPGTYHHLVARYNTNGTLDSSFDGDGWNVTDNAADNQGIQCAIQGDGKIVIAGHMNTGAPNYFDMFVTRFNADGSLDLSFDGDGRSQFAGVPGKSESASGIAIDLDGKIVICGISASPMVVAVARILP